MVGTTGGKSHLGHNKNDMTSRYAHLAQDAIKVSSGRVADSIGADILDREPRKAAVSAWRPEDARSAR